MGTTDDMITVMNNWWDYTLVWVGLIVAVVFILLFIVLFAKLSSISRTLKTSFRDLNNKIDSLYRTSDAFNELNAKIDNLNKTTNDLKRPTAYIPTS